MDWKSLKMINILTAVVVFLLFILGKLVPSIYGLIAAFISSALFWIILYINVRKSILDFIDARRGSKIRIDPLREERLKQIKYCVYIIGLLIGILSIIYSLIYMLSLLIWAVLFSLTVMLMVSFYNLFITVTYLIAKKPIIIYTNLAILVIFIILSSAFVWVYMNSQFVWFLIALVLFILSMVVYSNASITIKVLKIINDKPVDLKKDRLIKIINNSSIIVIIALILIMLNKHSYFAYILLNNLIVPLIVLMIVANAWKFIYDIS